MKVNIGDIIYIKAFNTYAKVLDKGDYGVELNQMGMIIKYRYVYWEVLNVQIQPQTKILCKHSDFLRLKKTHGIGVFYHNLSPLYEKLCIKPTKFVTFRDIKTKETVTFRLGKAIKVLKRIGFEYNENYKPVRIVKPMVKLQFIREL